LFGHGPLEWEADESCLNATCGEHMQYQSVNANCRSIRKAMLAGLSFSFSVQLLGLRVLLDPFLQSPRSSCLINMILNKCQIKWQLRVITVFFQVAMCKLLMRQKNWYVMQSFKLYDFFLFCDRERFCFCYIYTLKLQNCQVWF